jgi:thioredoxin-like negative regulator of GroEL/glutathione synthase/RimK-type ligase-like ATP-grasp enzyme
MRRVEIQLMTESAKPDSDPRLAEAFSLFKTGQFELAAALCRHVLDTAPDDGAALRQLARIELARGRFHDALAVLRLISDIGADEAWIYAGLGMATEMGGGSAEAIAHYERAIVAGENSATIKSALARCMRRSGRIQEAMAWLAALIADDPNAVDARLSLADALVEQRETAEAEQVYRDAIAAASRNGADPDTLFLLHVRLASLLTVQGNRDAALPHWRESLPWNRASISSGDRLRVLMFWTSHGCNSRVRNVIDLSAMRVQDLPVVPGLDYPADPIDRGYNVVFNAISDPDVAAAELQLAARIEQSLRLRVLNPASKILLTARDVIAQRLAGLPHAVVPKTIRSDRAQAAHNAEMAGLRYPLIARPIGTHSGEGATKLDDQPAFADYLADAEDGPLYLTEFADYQSRDGVWRKYRIMFVGGRIFPCHLSISAGWLNHYFRSEMSRSDLFRQEEERFLADPAAYFGDAVMEALSAIPARIGLDYFGLDCGVDEQGRLVVFECNASMLVHMPTEDLYAYRRGSVRAIQQAFTALLGAAKQS